DNTNDNNNDNNHDNNNTGNTTLEVVDAPVAGTAYKFGMVQGNVGEDVYFLIGGMNGYYMATDIAEDAAIDVYLEDTTGGYYMYAMVAGEKKYINMVVSGTHVNGAYEDAASTVYTYDAEKKTVVATVNEDLYWFATRNDATYTTLGPAKVSYDGFYGQFYAAAAADDNNGGTNNDNTNNDTNNNTNNDNGTQSPDTGYSVVVFAVVAVMAAAAVVVFTKKVRA
ncbi:MAG: hypothetical protein IJN65_06325, partial [Clostridia bacterium]|nr:hypothetical protein [Clostridia bacterium]